MDVLIPFEVVILNGVKDPRICPRFSVDDRGHTQFVREPRNPVEK